ncbi:putative cytochrome P450 [Xylariales sp. PMI_506]|nr:putative cytochrome P450 [Xylariales sp. PMI_506]
MFRTRQLLLWQTAIVIYNVWFHPLRNFPGPLANRASGLPWAIQQVLGVQAFHTHKLHEQYGSVVRISPNHLVFTDPRAWKDIYGHRVGNNKLAMEMPKCEDFVNALHLTERSIVNAAQDEHQKLRRGLSHGFSDGSMRQQEPLISEYVDLLIQQLHRSCENGKIKMNIEAWYNWTTFDIVGDLVFGSPFNCLQNMDYHPWIARILEGVKYSSLPIALNYLGYSALVQVIFQSGALRSIKIMRRHISEFIERRLSIDIERNDLFEGLVKRRKEWNLSFERLCANAFILVLAGSETTATTLSGATYLLLTHPEVLHRLQQEVRSTFRNSSDININSVNSLSYMLGVLNEALRLYPPLSSGMVRVVPSDGMAVAGHCVPRGTKVEVQHWSMYHSKDNWNEPWAFNPERFLVNSETAAKAGNNLDSLQPFSLGPRNCIGRNLAYAEMRLILARIIFDFDLKLADDSKEWIERQKSFMLWDRLPLNVYLTPRAKAL